MRREISTLLCIVPPYPHGNCPPAGAAALLGHLKASGCDDFRFLDLRLLAPDIHSPTYNPVGVFGESFIIDVPDLPLVLRVLKGSDDACRDSVGGPRDAVFDRYSYERGIDPARLHAYLVEMDQFLEDVFAPLGDLRFVGFSVWSSNLTTTLMAAARLKRRRRSLCVIVGGPQVTESRAAALLGLRAGLFDAVVLGEGEQALLDVYRGATKRDDRWQACRGSSPWTRRARRSFRRAALLHLSSLAAPDFTEMFLPAYRAPDGRLRLPFQFSRGCTDKCTFCSEWVFWERFRPAAVDQSVEQLRDLSARYGINRFHFTDSLINGHMKRLRHFAQAVIDRELVVDWGGFMRADMDDDTARLLKAAGCSYAFIGVESLSDETLDLMNKRRTSADNLRAIQAFLDAGIPVAVGVIPGYPGDTRERFLRTVQELTRIADCHPGMFSFNVEPFIVSPSQPLYGRLQEVGLTAHPWDGAVLDIAPRYRDVTEQIGCRVEGANQGVERLGQLKLLRVLLNGRSANPASGAFDREEDLPSDRVRFIGLGPACLVLARQRGRLAARIMTLEERETCIAIIEKSPRTAALFDGEAFRRFWGQVGRAHAWPCGARAGPARSAARVEALFVPDHVVGRVVEGAGGGPVLFVANAANLASMKAPAWAAPILAWLAEDPREIDLVTARLGALGVDPGEWRAWLEWLQGDGLITNTTVRQSVSPTDRVELDTTVEPTPGAIFRVVQEGGVVSLHAPGTRINGPARIAPALQFIARTRRFTPRALPDSLTPDARLVLVRRLVRERLLTVVNLPANAASEP